MGDSLTLVTALILIRELLKYSNGPNLETLNEDSKRLDLFKINWWTYDVTNGNSTW